MENANMIKSKEMYSFSQFELSKEIRTVKFDDLKRGEIALLREFTQYWNPKKATFFPGIKLLADRLNYSERHIMNLTAQLRDKGYILILSRAGKVNHYSFTEKFWEAFHTTREISSREQTKNKTKDYNKDFSENFSGSEKGEILENNKSISTVCRKDSDNIYYVQIDLNQAKDKNISPENKTLKYEDSGFPPAVYNEDIQKNTTHWDEQQSGIKFNKTLFPPENSDFKTKQEFVLCKLNKEEQEAYFKMPSYRQDGKEDKLTFILRKFNNFVNSEKSEMLKLETRKLLQEYEEYGKKSVPPTGEFLHELRRLREKRELLEKEKNQPEPTEFV